MEDGHRGTSWEPGCLGCAATGDYGGKPATAEGRGASASLTLVSRGMP
jgi:hypothetical protein